MEEFATKQIYNQEEETSNFARVDGRCGFPVYVKYIRASTADSDMPMSPAGLARIHEDGSYGCACSTLNINFYRSPRGSTKA